MAINIEEVVNAKATEGTGLFRFRLIVDGLVFRSEPMRKDEFLVFYSV